jgi:hypothetical protein
MIIGVLVGYIIGLSIIAAIGALLMKLGVKIVAGKKVDFGKAFSISFVASVAAILSQALLGSTRLQGSIFDVAPGVVFFVVCWLLSALFVRHSDDENAPGYGKAFLSTLVQCTGLFVITLVFSLVLLAALSSKSTP